jgi:hypothetical protein
MNSSTDRRRFLATCALGWRCRHAPSRRVRPGRRRGAAGVQPLRTPHHGREVRIRPRQPVREDPHEPGDLGGAAKQSMPFRAPTTWSRAAASAFATRAR